MTLFASSFLLHLSLTCTYIFVTKSGKRPKNRFHAIKIFFAHYGDTSISNNRSKFQGNFSSHFRDILDFV